MIAPKSSTLPDLPPITLTVHRRPAADARAVGGFVDVHRLELLARYPDGVESAPFRYDIAVRKSLDAVVMAAWARLDGVPHVYLRSAIRPPCALRAIPPFHDGLLWELPAGLIDDGETDAEAAARELEEEIGITVPPSAMAPLGGFTFPSGGVIGERHIYFHVEVDPDSQTLPGEDGSALERGASIVLMPVRDALNYCAAGRIPDAKTELGLRRLMELL